MRPSISSVGVTDLTSGGSDQLASLEGFIDTVEIGAAEAEADAPRRKPTRRGETGLRWLRCSPNCCDTVNGYVHRWSVQVFGFLNWFMVPELGSA